MIDIFIEEQKQFGFPIIDNTIVYFVSWKTVLNVSLLVDMAWLITDNNLKSPDSTIPFCQKFIHSSCNDEPIPFTKIPDTNLFYLKQIFDVDTRIDYQFLIPTSVGLTIENDILNNKTIDGISELIMPGWQDNTAYLFDANLTSILLVDNLKSSALGDRTVNFQIYLPPNYDPNAVTLYKSLYVADGAYYVNQVKVKNVLDYLIHNNIIEPIIGIFVDPFGGSARIAEYNSTDCNMLNLEDICRQNYAQFLKAELVPYIDNNYLTIIDSQSRAHIGLSAGGHVSGYLASKIPDTFKLIGSQSGAFQLDPSVIDALENLTTTEGFRFYLNAGTYETPILIFSTLMTQMLEEEGYLGKYRIFNTGHSVGQWRSTLGEMLIFLFTNEPPDYSGTPVLRSSLDSEFKTIPIQHTTARSESIPAFYLYSLIIIVLIRVSKKKFIK